ncbi:MAG: DUF3990 domain-containing protein [Clostridia bacterium]|nr:DUF3990 domain-containing protein [Clostridia bacterium]
MGKIRLYHSGYEIIREPDIRRGRKNADLGQGFYLSADASFARRWARQKPGEKVIVNEYELDDEGLSVFRFQRDGDWFDYVFSNRRGEPDRLFDRDVIEGPIANDTLFDTMGVLTSGFLKRETARALLDLGPVYRQTVIKTERAAKALRFTGHTVLSDAATAAAEEALRREEADYQRRFAALLEKLTEEKA